MERFLVDGQGLLTRPINVPKGCLSTQLSGTKTVRLVHSSAESLKRVAAGRVGLEESLSSREVSESLGNVLHPKSLAGGMKKAGVALILSPDPVTGVPGAALLLSAYALKKKEPSSIDTLVRQANKILRDIESLNI